MHTNNTTLLQRNNGLVTWTWILDCGIGEIMQIRYQSGAFNGTSSHQSKHENWNWKWKNGIF